MKTSCLFLPLGLALALSLGCTDSKHSADGKSATAPAKVAATPEDAVKQFEAAAIANDFDGMCDVTAASDSDMLRDSRAAAKKWAALHAELQAALDAKFGKADGKYAAAFDNEGIGMSIRNLDFLIGSANFQPKGVQIVKKEPDGENFKLELEMTEARDGKEHVTTQKALALKQDGSWKLKFSSSASPEDAKKLRDEKIGGLEKLQTSYQTAIREVKAGKYTQRKQVNKVMLWAFEDFDPGVKYFEALSERADRGGLIQDDEPAAPSVRLRITIPADPAKPLELNVQTPSAPSQDPILLKPTELIGSLKEIKDQFKDGSAGMDCLLHIEPEVSADRILPVLTVLVDADIERFTCDLNEKEYAQLEKQFEGRLRIFTRRPHEEDAGSPELQALHDRQREARHGVEDLGPSDLEKLDPAMEDLNLDRDVSVESSVDTTPGIDATGIETTADVIVESLDGPTDGLDGAAGTHLEGGLSVGPSKLGSGRALAGAEKADRKIVFVLDRSASMQPHLEALKRELTALCDRLTPGQEVNFIWAAPADGPKSGAEPVFPTPLEPVDKQLKERLTETLKGVKVEGSTDLAAAMAKALELQPGSIVVVTDHDLKPDQMESALKGSKPFTKVHVFALYARAKDPADRVLEQIAQKTHGRYREIPVSQPAADAKSAPAREPDDNPESK